MGAPVIPEFPSTPHASHLAKCHYPYELSKKKSPHVFPFAVQPAKRSAVQRTGQHRLRYVSPVEGAGLSVPGKFPVDAERTAHELQRFHLGANMVAPFLLRTVRFCRLF